MSSQTPDLNQIALNTPAAIQKHQKGSAGSPDLQTASHKFERLLQQQVQDTQLSPTVSLQSASQAATRPIADQDKSTTEAVADFLAWMQMSPSEKIRDRILKSLGLTEADLENMAPEERAKTEAIIAERMREEIELQMRQHLVGQRKTGNPA